MQEERIKYRINQMTDTGTTVNLALSEDVELEAVSQQQMMLEAIDRAVTDKEVKDQIKAALLPEKQQEVFKKLKDDLKKSAKIAIKEDVLNELGGKSTSETAAPPAEAKPK